MVAPDAVTGWVEYIAAALHTTPSSLEAMFGMIMAIGLLISLLLPITKFFNSFFEKYGTGATTDEAIDTEQAEKKITTEHMIKIDLLKEELIIARKKIQDSASDYTRDLEKHRREERAAKIEVDNMKRDLKRMQSKLEFREAEVVRHEKDYDSLRDDFNKLQSELGRTQVLLEKRAS